MKLFVDDTRKPPERGFECAEDYDGAVFFLRYLEFEFVTLDYSLGDSPNGLEILKFMHENKKYPKHLNIHSNHIEGREIMRRYAEENFPSDVKITMNMLDK
ncbi:MAG: hypothetical protein IJF18_07745 [Oscillospiraceae bacterium]|nr:hypothetical protein [Oscillospiraceae bacterium]